MALVVPEGYDIVSMKMACCREKFLFLKKLGNYGEDIPKFCPRCGSARPEFFVSTVARLESL